MGGACPPWRVTFTQEVPELSSGLKDVKVPFPFSFLIFTFSPSLILIFGSGYQYSHSKAPLFSGRFAAHSFSDEASYDIYGT